MFEEMMDNIFKSKWKGTSLVHAIRNAVDGENVHRRVFFGLPKLEVTPIH